MFSFTACADDLDLGLLYPLSAYLAVYLAAEPYLRNKLVAERIDNRKAYAVQTSGDLIAAAPNLPPAWSMVSATSSADLPVFGWISTGYRVRYL